MTDSLAAGKAETSNWPRFSAAAKGLIGAGRGGYFLSLVPASRPEPVPAG